MREPDRFFCGGSLINSRYVLTAAQCLKKIVDRRNLSSVLFGLPGGDDDYDIFTPQVLDIKIAEKIVHPDYRITNGVSFNDIALLRLSRDVEFNDVLKPICLPSANNWRNKDYSGQNLTAAGWGNITQT